VLQLDDNTDGGMSATGENLRFVDPQGRCFTVGSFALAAPYSVKTEAPDGGT
jgi:hypothetical protein